MIVVDAPVPQGALWRVSKAKTKACSRGKEASEVISFRGSPPPDPHSKWIGEQDETEIPNEGRLLEAPSGFPDGLLVVEDESGSSSKYISLCSTLDRKELLAY
jgi:hypothetical protein